MTYSRSKRRRRIAAGEHLPAPKEGATYSGFWAGMARRAQQLAHLRSIEAQELREERYSNHVMRDGMSKRAWRRANP